MRNAFELSYSYSVELHRSSHQRCSKTKGVLNIFAKFTGKHLSQILFFNKVAGIRPVTSLKERLWSRRFFMNFAKLRTPILKTICERLLAAGWRTTQKLNRRDLLLLRCLVYINISVASSFPFFYLRFLYTYLKLNLQTKNYVENFGRFQNLTSKNKTKFSGCPDEYGPTNMVMWNLQIKILYILGHTDNDKGRLQHANSKSRLLLHNFREVQLGNKQLSSSNTLTI